MSDRLIFLGKPKHGEAKRSNQTQSSFKTRIMRLDCLLEWFMRRMTRRQTEFTRRSMLRWMSVVKCEGRLNRVLSDIRELTSIIERRVKPNN